MTLVRNTMHDRRVFLAIMAISFFWTIGAVLFIQFPPLAKNVLHASKQVASLFLVIFSIGIAIGSVSINALLKGTVSARYAPVSVIAMGLFVVLFYLCLRGLVSARANRACSTPRVSLPSHLPFRCCSHCWALPSPAACSWCRSMPFSPPSSTRPQTARTIAANNIVNSGAMVVGSLLAIGLSAGGIPITHQLLLSAAMCLVSAWLGQIALSRRTGGGISGQKMNAVTAAKQATIGVENAWRQSRRAMRQAGGAGGSAALGTAHAAARWRGTGGAPIRWSAPAGGGAKRVSSPPC